MSAATHTLAPWRAEVYRNGRWHVLPSPWAYRCNATREVLEDAAGIPQSPPWRVVRRDDASVILSKGVTR